MNTYDVAIIGGGISGLMLAYELTLRQKVPNIIIIEKGTNIENRNCPVITKKADSCCRCKLCAITNGLAGAGAFSDGKFIITTEYGGLLSDFIEPSVSTQYMEKADEILRTFGATDHRFLPNDNLKSKCIQNGLYMKQGIVKHFGTENTLKIMKAFINKISLKCNILTEKEVKDVNKDNHEIKFSDNQSIKANNIIFAVGRNGNSFFANWCKNNGINLFNNNVDVGVRVELPSLIWQNISRIVYDPKISYRTAKYGDTTRMFCFNEGGQVVTENKDGIITVNGHAYAEGSLKTENSNFALLSSVEFSEPFHEPNEYLKCIAGLANYITDGNVIIQRYGDLINGQRTTNSRLQSSTVKPTLKATPGDLSLCMPKRQLDNIIETIEQLNKIAPGTANYDTLLYGVECKYYSARPEMSNFELASCSKIYACGDGAGITRSFAQAAANGLYLADILET